MSQTKYLIIGSSHGGLSALDAIRVHDEEGSITIVSRENTNPYSPTILPYVIAGIKGAEDVDLRDPGYFEKLNATFKNDDSVTRVDPGKKTVKLDTGEDIQYEKLLITTGADASIPPFPGVDQVPYHVVRTLEDTKKLRSHIEKSKSAIVLGAGLIAMHTAETLAHAGLQVTVVVRRQVSLFAYFSGDAAKMIEKVFADNNVRIATGHGVEKMSHADGVSTVTLQSGEDLTADIVVMATGVQPRIGCVEGSGIETDQGILVDNLMRTSAPDVWAAGDVAQAPDFFDQGKTINATLPNASIQGRIAGMDMAGDPAVKPYLGSSGLNTFNFFGHHGFSVGLGTINESTDEIELNTTFLPSGMRYQKLVFQDNRLVGCSAINPKLDPGVMRELIQREIDLSDVMEKFANAPRETGRLLMTKLWR
ncbi:MAG: NAD(P)/FAD-dependent oxidoreductase [Deltaproteobacteria bacterium]|nr:NAD(P)/FAD-dependent oxidoreductase [Deltaproteobacteria bacterium]